MNLNCIGGVKNGIPATLGSDFREVLQPRGARNGNAQDDVSALWMAPFRREIHCRVIAKSYAIVSKRGAILCKTAVRIAFSYSLGTPEVLAAMEIRDDCHSCGKAQTPWTVAKTI